MMTENKCPVVLVNIHCRQHMILAKQKSEEAKEKEDASEQDLFSDMAPTIKRQKKIFIGERGSGGGSGAEQGSRLRAVEQDPLVRRMMMVMIKGERFYREIIVNAIYCII